MLEELLLLVPIGLIGLYRWSSWIIRYMIARRYKPIENNYTEPVSVIVPIFNEKQDVLERCLDSIKKK